MKNIFRWGVVGCGGVSRFLGWACRLNPRMALTHAVDPNPDTLHRFAKAFGVRRADADLQPLLENEDVDAVYVATPHFLHAPQTLAALRAGKPILCEKPLALTLDEALALHAAAQEAGIKVGVNHQFRYDAGCYALRQAVVAGELGFVSKWDCRTRFGRDPDYFLKGVWRGRKDQSGGGTLFTHGSHALDIALWSRAADPISVSAVMRRVRHTELDVEDEAEAEISMADGSHIRLSSSILERDFDPLRLDAYGGKASGHYQGFLRSRLRFHPQSRGERIRPQSPPVRGCHAYFRSVEAFRLWVQDDSPFLSPLEASLPLLAVLNAAYASAASGNPEIPDLRWKALVT